MTRGEPPVTPSERERRIEAGMRAWLPLGSPPLDRRVVASILDAADEAMPVVSEAIVDEMVWLRREEQKRDLEQRAERAEAENEQLRGRISRLEAAARAVLPILGMGPTSTDFYTTQRYRAMARLGVVLDGSGGPSFSGEEGTDG